MPRLLCVNDLARLVRDGASKEPYRTRPYPARFGTRLKFPVIEATKAPAIPFRNDRLDIPQPEDADTAGGSSSRLRAAASKRCNSRMSSAQ